MMSMILIISGVAVLGSTPSCKPLAGADPASVLRRAVVATGLHSVGDTVLNIRGFDIRQDAYMSDRMYPPWLAEVESFDQWFDLGTGVQRNTTHTTIGGYEFDRSTIGDARASYIVRDTTLVPSESTHGALYETRPLNVWAMLDDWLAAKDVRVEGQCVYRDYPRVVLSRRGLRGPERLFLDRKSGYPIKLDRVEPHYLWGQIHVEFIYSTWERVGGGHLPAATFRMEDGVTVVARDFGPRRFVPRDSAPSLTLPAGERSMALGMPAFLEPTKPDTARVTARTFVLRNRGYGETVTLLHDTVYVFDATQGEERVRQDSIWIAALFPGHHPVVLVVTDLAWPHIAGVRSWVAHGAVIVSHPAARTFLTEVVDRRWTLEPDLLERERQHIKFQFRAVNDSLALAGGDILVFPIDGAASEVALAAFIRPSRFLWASDFIQDLSEPTQYVDEVVAATQRVGITPDTFAAEHVPLTEWGRVRPLAERVAGP